MAGRLAIVPTPVGNLSDMSPRAVETLREASLVLAEDTRTSGVLLRHFGISTPMASHHKYNEHKPLDAILDRIAAGETIALVSDAGTPGISDPGFMLARECRRRGLVVETCRDLRRSCPRWSARGCRATAFSSKASCRLKKAGHPVCSGLPSCLRHS